VRSGAGRVVAVNPVIEYIYDLAREHTDELKLVGVAVVFGLLYVALNLAKRG